MNTLLEHAKSQFDLVTDEKVRTLVREMLSIANEMHLDTRGFCTTHTRWGL